MKTLSPPSSLSRYLAICGILIATVSASHAAGSHRPQDPPPKRMPNDFRRSFDGWTTSVSDVKARCIATPLAAGELRIEIGRASWDVPYPTRITPADYYESENTAANSDREARFKLKKKWVSQGHGWFSQEPHSEYEEQMVYQLGQLRYLGENWKGLYRLDVLVDRTYFNIRDGKKILSDSIRMRCMLPSVD